MANEPLELVLGAKLTTFLADLARGAKGMDDFANRIARAKRTITNDLAGIERSLKAMPAALQGLLAAAGTLANFSNQTKAAAREADLALRELGATAIDTARAVNDGFGGAADAADRAGGRIGAAAGRARAAAGNLGGAGNEAKSGLARAFGAMEDGVNGTGRRIKSVLTDVRTAVAAIGGLAIGNEIVDSTTAFEDALGQLAIVADDTGVPIDTFRKKLLALSETTPQELVGLTNSLATAIGSLPKGTDQAAQGFAALDAAQKAARASGSSTEEVLQGITAVLNTYGKTGITAQQVSDKLFAAFDQGAATVPEIAGSIGQIAGIAQTFGIGIDEVLGSIAVLTRGGQSASEAISNLRQAYVTVSSEQKNITDQAKALGIEFDTNALRTKGLIGVLEDLQQKGGEPYLRQLFTDTQGFLGASTLLSAGLEQVRDDIARVGDSTGKTDAALAKIKDNFSQTAGIAKNQLETTLIAIGEKLLPKLQQIVEDVGNFLVENKDAFAEGFSKLFDVLTTLGGWVIDHGPEIITLLAGFGIGNVLGGAADAAKSLSEELNGLAESAGSAGERAGELGEDLSEHLGESFTGKIAGQIAKGLKFASTAAEVIGAAILIGNVIGDAIGDSMNMAERLKQQLIQARNDQLDAEMLARAKAAGYASVEAFKEAQRQLASGESVLVDGAITKVADAVSTGRSEAIQDAIAGTETKIAELSDRADQLKAEAAAARNTRDRIKAQLESGYLTPNNKASAGEVFGAIVSGDRSSALVAAQRVDTRLADADAKVRNLEADAKAAAEALIAADAQRQGIEEALAATAGEATSGNKAGKKPLTSSNRKAAKAAAEEAKRQAEDLARAESELAAARAQADQTALDALERKTESAIRANEREAAAASEYAVKIGGSQEEVTQAWDTATARIQQLVDQQVEIAQKAGDAEIQVARVAADEKIRQYEGSIEAQKIAAQQFAETEVRLREATADRIADIQRQQAARQIDLDQRRLAAIYAAAQNREARKPTPRVGATAFGDELNRVNRVGANPGASVGAAIGLAVGGPAGAVAGSDIAQSIAQLPQTLASAANFLRSGLTDLVSKLAEGAADFLDALLNGLPEQLDTLIGTVIPRVIQKLVGNLPKIIGGFIALLPRISAAIIANIPAIVGGFIRGLVDAADQIVYAITDGIKDAFGDIIAWIKDKLDVSDAVTGFGKALIGDPNASAGERVAAGITTLGVSEGVRFVRSLFHTGGSVRGPGDVGLSAQMALAGAPHFAFGGAVPRIGVGAQNAIRRALAGDDVPAILQAGEGVLSRVGMAALGGEAALASLNRGQSPDAGFGSLQVVLHARNGADRVLASHAIGAVSASIRRPDGGVRQVMDQTRPAGAPLMQRYVKR